MYKNMGKVKRTLEEYAILTVATLILVVGVYVSSSRIIFHLVESRVSRLS